MGATPPNNPMAQAQNNAAMRQALLATAPRMRKNVLTTTSGAGLTTRMKLFNVGVLTKLQLFVQASLTIAVAIAVPSTKAPWNLINRIRLTDYDGTDRINFSGFQMFILLCVRNKTFWGYNNSSAATAVFANPVVPTAIGNGVLSFFLDVPLAFDYDNPIVQLQDLRGSILAQTAVGEMYLSIDWIPLYYSNGNVDAVYSGAGTTTVVPNGTAGTEISCTMWQEYLLPQAIGGNGSIPLPGIDLMTVYELNGNVKSSDNLAVGTQKLISYPNIRSVIGTYYNYVQATTQTQGKISGFQLIANGNNILIDNTELSQLFYQRTYMTDDEDTIAGAYFRLHREKPMETALFGNVQMGITPNTVGATPYIEIGFESFYTKGQALPGLNQAQ
jgi:hypothetical protein